MIVDKFSIFYKTGIVSFAFMTTFYSQFTGYYNSEKTKPVILIYFFVIKIFDKK